MSRIEAVVFDFDGLILDTEYAEYVATAEAFERYGARLDEDEYAAIIGSSWNALDALLERATMPVPPRDELRTAFHARTREIHRTLEVLPGVTTWLADANQRGLPLAIASTSSEHWVTDHLARLGLLDAFSVLACCGGGEVYPAKPAPDCYIAACDALGIAPGNALAVEDSANGVRAAKAAGLWCVAVPNPLTRRLDLGAADVQLASLADATLVEVIDRVLERG